MDETLGAMAAGAIGTAVIVVVLLATEARSGFGAHVFRILSALVGSTGVVVGFVLFVAGGVIAWPLLYTTLGQYLPGTGPTQGMVFAFVLWLGFAPGFSGGTVEAAAPTFTDGGGQALIYLLVTLFAHLAYGAILGGGYERFADAGSDANADGG
jgi:hypothetical protein